MIWESSCMEDEQSWWYCLKHHTVEPDAGCPDKERLGPYRNPGGSGPRAGDGPSGATRNGTRPTRIDARRAAVISSPGGYRGVCDDAGRGAWWQMTARAAIFRRLPEARMAEIRTQRHLGIGAQHRRVRRDPQSVGFEPVGQVLGAAVYNIGYPGGYNCPGAWSGYGWYAQAVPQRDPGVRAGRLRLVRTNGPGHVRGAAPGHQPDVTECAELGGHGIVGVSLTIGVVPGGRPGVQGHRHRGPRTGRHRRSARPFSSDLSGQDFAKLISAGWVPAGLALGISVGARHDDWLTVGQTRWGAGNAEVVGYTELVNDTRHDARQQLEKDVPGSAGKASWSSRWTCGSTSASARSRSTVKITSWRRPSWARPWSVRLGGQAATTAGDPLARPAAPPGGPGTAGTLTGSIQLDFAVRAG